MMCVCDFPLGVMSRVGGLETGWGADAKEAGRDRVWRGVAGRGVTGRHIQFHPDASGYVQSKAGVAVAVAVSVLIRVMPGGGAVLCWVVA